MTPKRILVAENDPSILRMTTRWLQHVTKPTRVTISCKRREARGGR